MEWRENESLVNYAKRFMSQLHGIVSPPNKRPRPPDWGAQACTPQPAERISQVR